VAKEMALLHPPVREARLMNSSPEDVFRELHAEADAGRTPLRGDDAVERSLLDRAEPLITLALAQCGTSEDVVRDIYAGASGPNDNPLVERLNLGLRVACLSNIRLWTIWGFPFSRLKSLWGFPCNINQCRRTSTHRPGGVLRRIFRFAANPRIGERYLEALYTASEPFAGLDDKRWRSMVDASSKNLRLSNDQSTMEDPDLGFWNIHESIARLLEIAPTTMPWPMTIYTLARTLRPTQVHWLETPRPILERWRNADVGDNKNPMQGWLTHLPFNEELACYLAGLFGRKLNTADAANSDDTLIRCAHYAVAYLRPGDLEKHFKKDRGVFVMSALLNDHLLRDSKMRKPLELYLSPQLRHVFEVRMKEQAATPSYMSTNPSKLISPKPNPLWLQMRSSGLASYFLSP
jgi:hypothetical protein